MNDYINISYFNSCDAEIYYLGGFKQSLYLDTDFIAPEWGLDEEGQEDGDKEFIRTFAKVKKTYNCEFIAPEYLVQALAFMQIHDNIFVTLKTGETAKVIDMKIDKESIFSDCYSRIKLSLSIDFTRSTCCNNVECLEPNHAEIDGRYDTDSVQWTAPSGLVANGTRYLFYEPSTLYKGSIYTYDSGQDVWNVESQVTGDVVAFGEINMYLDFFWNDYPTISAAGYVLTGYAIPFSLVQAQNKQVGVWVNIGSPVSDGVYSGVGLTINPLDLVGTEVRVNCYNHSCDYGNSGSINV